jgi:hypothetical protein
MTILALTVAGTLALIAGLHIFWAFGGSWGRRVALPKKEDGHLLFSPGFLGCFVVAGALLAVASLCVARFSLSPALVSPSLATKFFSAMAVIFTLRFVGDLRYFGVFRKVRHTDFAVMDAKLFSPLCGLYAVAFVTLAVA